LVRVGFPVVIDACALYPYSLRDTLLRLAEAEFYDLYWSDEILAETGRCLVRVYGASEEKAAALITTMREAFDGAVVPAEQIERLIPAMTNDEDDRHVLAAAKAIGAEQIVTFNLGDFGDEHTAPLGIEAIHPDEFLLNQVSLDGQVVLNVLRRQAAAFDNPPWTLEELLDALRETVPQFVAAVEALLFETEPADA
jgi:predicted nucleic acid-binding protein